jgi:hypothetical protein
MLIGDTEANGAALRGQTLVDPDFVVFLGMTDARTSRPVRETAQAAEQSNNAIVMSRIYGAFFKWKAQRSHPIQPKDLMPHTEGGPSGDLNSNKKPVYTAAQEAEFQSRMRRQYYSGIGKPAEEAKRLAVEREYWSNEFAAARAEGRIQG